LVLLAVKASSLVEKEIQVLVLTKVIRKVILVPEELRIHRLRVKDKIGLTNLIEKLAHIA
jgi:hypothetical protein